MKIDIIGTGNMGWHLSRALANATDLRPVPARTLENLRNDSDLYLICVSDDVITEVSERVAAKVPQTSIIAHTSGSTPLSAISGLHINTGVFYPLQTFTKGVELNYAEIPFFIEGSNEGTRKLLEETAHSISNKVLLIDSGTRNRLHMASAIASNFANHLWNLADCYLTENGVSFKLLEPLLKETLRKAMETSPNEAQTGPAVRGDSATIERHLSLLEEYPELHEIYDLMTRSIIKKHSKKS